MRKSKRSKSRALSEGAGGQEAGDQASSPEEILAEYKSRGLAARLGFGARPAVLVVDLILGFTDPASPLGSDLDSEVQATVDLLKAARGRKAPVFFTTTAYDKNLTMAGLFLKKVPALRILTRGSKWVKLDPRLRRQQAETVIEKQYASAFFATPLASTLTALQVDTLLLAGCTTSGCIRATAVDALQHGFRAIVPRECVGDRAREPHVANLVDIDGKYGDVVGLDEVIEYLENLPDQD